MARKKAHFLSTPEILKFWSVYQETFSLKEASKSVDIVYATGWRVKNEIEQLLAGEKVKRVKGRDNLALAVHKIKKGAMESVAENPSLGLAPQTATEVQVERETVTEETVDLRSPEEILNTAFENFKKAVADYAYVLSRQQYEKFIAEKWDQVVVQEAQKSNVVGFIKSRWER